MFLFYGVSSKTSERTGAFLSPRGLLQPTASQSQQARPSLFAPTAGRQGAWEEGLLGFIPGSVGFASNAQSHCPTQSPPAWGPAGLLTSVVHAHVPSSCPKLAWRADPADLCLPSPLPGPFPHLDLLSGRRGPLHTDEKLATCSFHPTPYFFQYFKLSPRSSGPLRPSRRLELIRGAAESCVYVINNS